MGCFNHKGNFSNLPITYGDRIVVIVGVRPTSKAFGQELDNFSPGHSFVPISVPIRGEYNDYGGIENIDRTPAIDVLEKFFGMETTKLVDLAERTCCGCEDQMKDENMIAKEVLKTILNHSGYSDTELTLTYIMEHEKIFDHIVSIANPKKKDRYFWRIPHEYIEALGYRKNPLGTYKGYEVIEWTHETLPKLKEECYVWLEDEFKQYEKVSHTLAGLCEKIGCDVPEEFEETFFESVFKEECDSVNSEECDSMDFGKRDLEGYSFKRHCYGHGQGLFRYREGIGMTGCILSQFGFYEEHLKPEYMKEVVETAALIDGLHILELTWGVTNYYRQDVDYNQHLNFLEKCIEVVKEKKAEEEE